MSKELENIYDDLKKWTEEQLDEIDEQYGIWELNHKETKLIINYIINLQQENKQLKEQLEYLRSNEYLNQVKWERTFNEELVKDLQQKIDKALDMLDLIIPELWNISNAMTYKIKEVKNILGDKE